MESTDLEWLRGYVRDGDGAAFARLVDRHAGWLLAAARRRLQDEHLAEDATQAVFLVLASKASSIVESDQRSLAAWLFYVMHLTCGRLRRSCGRRARHELAAGALDAAATVDLPDDNLRVFLEEAIAQLPPADRQAVVMRFYQGQDYRAIAGELGCSSEAARKRVARALQSVRDWMLAQDGIDTIPDELLAGANARPEYPVRLAGSATRNARVGMIAKGALTMMQQAEVTNFTMWSAEYVVTDVEQNLDFFEKLGFRRHFIDVADAMGRITRASLRGGKTARIWLRRADSAEGIRPAPGVIVFLWIDGGPDSLTAQRDALAAQGLQPSAFFDDINLRRFTVTSPDGYTIGFFTVYR